MVDEIKRLVFLAGVEVDPPSNDGAFGLIEIFNLAIDNAEIINGYAYFVAPRDLSFEEVEVELFQKNGVSSGNLTIDIQKGVNEGAMATIFGTKPTFNFATAADYSISNGVQSVTTCDEGDLIRLDLNSVPSGFNGKFHVRFYGTPT